MGDTERVPLPEGVGERVPDSVALLERVPDGVELGEVVDEGVDVAVPPADAVWLLVGVGLGLGTTTPCTYKGPAYTVPALTTESHALVGKEPAVVPVRTRVRLRRP